MSGTSERSVIHHNLTLAVRLESSKTRDVSYDREISQASYLDIHTETGKLKTRDVSYKREISHTVTT